MARAPFQVLIIPFKIVDGIPKYAVTRRTDNQTWLFMSGGGEGSETPLDAAKREAFEEGQIPLDCDFIILDSLFSLPVALFKNRNNWDKSLFVIPQYCFAVDIKAHEIVLNEEHDQLKWMDYEGTSNLLDFDSNKTALWELSERLKNNKNNR